jgi:glutaredoxin
MSFGTQQPLRDPEIVVYGTDGCAATQMIRRSLQRHRIPYRYVDVEEDPKAAAQIRWWTGGAVKHPTVYIDGAVLVEPTLEELQWVLASVDS